MDLKPVIWISSVDHLENYYEILRNASIKDRLFSNYNMPEEFSRVSRRPLTYFSIGEIVFEGELLYHSIELEKTLFNKYFTSIPHNLKEVSFVLKPYEIISIDFYHFQDNNKSYTKREWIRIICDEKILGGDFLICVDGVSNTKRLFEMITQFKKGLGVSTTLEDLSNTKMIFWGYVGIVMLLLTAILNFIATVTETYNGITTSVILLFIATGFILSIRTQRWFMKNFKEGSRAIHYGLLFNILFSGIIIINLIIINYF